MPKLEKTKYKVLVSEKTYEAKLIFKKDGTIKNKDQTNEDGSPKTYNIYGLFDMRCQSPEQEKERDKMPFKQKFDFCWKIQVIELGKGIRHYYKDKQGKDTINKKYVWDLALYTNDCETWINPDNVIHCIKHSLKRKVYKKPKGETVNECFLYCTEYVLEQAASEQTE